MAGPPTGIGRLTTSCGRGPGQPRRETLPPHPYEATRCNARRANGVLRRRATPWPGHAARPLGTRPPGEAAPRPYYPPTSNAPTPSPLGPPSPTRGRGEMVRVRRGAGPHRPSPFTKGGGVGEGDSTRGPGHAARPPGPRPRSGRPAGSPLPAAPFCPLPAVGYGSVALDPLTQPPLVVSSFGHTFPRRTRPCNWVWLACPRVARPRCSTP